jgi:1-acyl-sn-glycerol-3-phosphate acyltransferase
MRRIIVWISMTIAWPALQISRLKSKAFDLQERLHLARLWSGMVLRFSKAYVKVRNENLIPLENGYSFIANHVGKHDLTVLMASNPLDAHFMVSKQEKWPYLSGFLSLCEAIRFTPESLENDAIDAGQRLANHQNLMMLLHDLNGISVDVKQFNGAYLSKTAIIPVALINTERVARKKVKVTVSFCTPLHFEEYGEWTPEALLHEIETRIQTEIAVYQSAGGH